MARKKRHRKSRRSHRSRKSEPIAGVIELTKKKPRKEEEKFFIKLSGTQLNVILLIIFLVPFLFDGVIGYFNIKDQFAIVKPWFLMTLFSLFFMVLSVVLMTIGTVIFPLRIKRELNLISFGTFMGGFALFLVSLLVLLVVVIVL